jgi:L-lactate dehydrogenase complex protein LldG
MATKSTDSRDRILARIREALSIPAPPRHLDGQHDAHSPAGPGSARAWLPYVPSNLEDRIALFEKNSAALRTEFFKCSSPADIGDQLQQIAHASGWRRVATHDFDLGRPAVSSLPIPVIRIQSGYNVADLEQCDAGITGCECLVAQTGSILVSARSSGGRVLSVLPPHHVVIASRAQFVGDLSDALAMAKENHQGEAPAFLSFITGPSRTGDIERILVLGAHGPKRLTVLFADY